MKRTPSKKPQFLATRQWNHIVESFQQQVPIKPVRYRLRLYCNCFTGAQAVNWLKNFFNESGAYGTVTTAQVEKFCQKLLEMSIILDACRSQKGTRKTSDAGVRAFINGPLPYTLPERILQKRVARKGSQENLLGTGSIFGWRHRPGSAERKSASKNSLPHASSNSSLPRLALCRSSSLPFCSDNRGVPISDRQPTAPARRVLSTGKVDHYYVNKICNPEEYVPPPPAKGDPVRQVGREVLPAKEGMSYGHSASNPVSSISPEQAFKVGRVLAVGSLDDVISLLADKELPCSPDDRWTGNIPSSVESHLTMLRSLTSTPAVSRPARTSTSAPDLENFCIPNAELITNGSGRSEIFSLVSNHSSSSSSMSSRDAQSHAAEAWSVQSSPRVYSSRSVPSTIPGGLAADQAARQALGSNAAHSLVCRTSSFNPSVCSATKSANISETILSSEDAWKETILSRLLQCVEISTLEAIIHCVQVDGKHIAANCGYPIDDHGGFIPLSLALKRRRSWPANCYPHLVAPLYDCEWSGVHAMCPRSTTGVNISYTPLICSAMDRLSSWPQKSYQTCCEFWMERGIEDILPTLAQHFRRTVDGPLIPIVFYPLFFAVSPLLRNKKHSRSVEALQYCLILLPPERRILLERLLVFLAACQENQRLVLDPEGENIDVVLNELVPYILHLRPGAPVAQEAMEVVCFMAMNVSEVFKVPKGIIEDLQCHIASSEPDTISNDSGVPGDSDSLSHCSQTTTNISESSLLQLLDVLLAGVNMTKREQHKRLREFRRVYPSLYKRRLPTSPRASRSSTSPTSTLRRTSAKRRKRRQPSNAAASIARVGMRLSKSFKGGNAIQKV